MEAVILAGGFGTRLAHIVSDVPKPMAPVAGRPFLSFILEDLEHKGVTRTVLAVGYKHECIMKTYGDTYGQMALQYEVEDKPLLTGGAIRKALESCKEETVFIINGDTFFDVPLQEMDEYFHKTHTQIAVAVKKMHDFERYGTVSFDEYFRIKAFVEKRPQKCGYINGGIYLVQRELFAGYPDVFSFERCVLEDKVELYQMQVFISDGYFIDIGIPEDFRKAQIDFSDHKP